MAHDILLGLDLGSTSFKAVAASPDGQELAVAGVPTPWDHAATGTTMSPGAVEDAARTAVLRCLNHLDDARVVSVGITGMAEAGFLVDEMDAERSDAYAWFDERGSVEAGELAQDLTPGRFSSMTGLPVTARCSAVKIRRTARDGISLRSTRWESLPDWMARRLGGDQAAELSLAARTGLLDIHVQDWSEELLQWTGLDRAHMPPLRAPGTAWGTGRPGSPLEGAVLTVAGHDHVCAAIGAGASGLEDALDSIGTGEAVLCARTPMDAESTLRAVEAGLTVGIHVVPGHQLLMAGLGTGGRLSRVLTLLGISDSEALRGFEATIPPGTTPQERAGWASELVRDGTIPEDLPVTHDDPVATWCSAVAAAGSRLDDAIDRLERFTGRRNRVVTTGGWYRSAVFRRLRRATVTRSLALPAVAEATGLGAALMGGLAAHLYPNPLSVPQPTVHEL